MSDAFFEQPILNSPYEYPSRHWHLDSDGQPTQQIVEKRRSAEFITPIPKPKKRKREQQELVYDEGQGLSSEKQSFEATSSMINEVRQYVDMWRKLPNSKDWKVTPETARLLHHWRHHEFAGFRPFFCQVEAVEVAIWLTEVAPKMGDKGKKFLDYLKQANEEANPEIFRIALKLATGAGKTTVMAMLIAWQTINAVRQPGSKHFTRGFLVVTPGITIKDRLRVLQPNAPDSYYRNFELVPQDMMPDLMKAKIVITNYHAFKLRERFDVAKGTRQLLKGRNGEDIITTETEGQMMQRVMPELMSMERIIVINDEAHHCYREKPDSEEEQDLKGEERKEAEKNREAARLWISGIEAVNRIKKVSVVIDLSATPFFISGSGYPEGVIFPWTMSDFSLMDAIECGIVKLPRVPIADNLPDSHRAEGSELPMFRDLWTYIGKKMPKKSRADSGKLNPLDLPPQLQTALEALYGHYKETFDLWQESGVKVPPCFIIVCNNTATSKLVYDYVSGFRFPDGNGQERFHNGRLELFRNYDDNGYPIKPRTLLIDSLQLESGEQIDDAFKEVASEEIDRFKRELAERTNDPRAGEKISDEQLLREVMNTVGKYGQLGGDIRCVVSVSMLTEGWDANNVTHILGVRAFGTQLLCEQVVGRALRRQSYETNSDGLFNVEYADIFGIPFNFTAKPVVAPIQKPRETINVRAVRPERDELEITFPRVAGFQVELPKDDFRAVFNEDSTLELTPELVGATETRNAAIIGKGVDLTLESLQHIRKQSLAYELTNYLTTYYWKDEDGNRPTRFDQFQKIVRDWLESHLVCKGNTFPAQLRYKTLAEMACSKIAAGITRAHLGENRVKAILDPYNPLGSTSAVNFNTSKRDRWETDSRKCHVNWVILDSDWEAEFCRVAESHPQVIKYVKNHNLGLDVPYQFGSEVRRYVPDFIVQIDDGKGADDPLNLIVEIKGYRGEDAKEKKATMETKWVEGVNNLKAYGRWDFVEFCDVYQMSDDFESKVASLFSEMVTKAIKGDS
jgi:type III restriction enzyme